MGIKRKLTSQLDKIEIPSIEKALSKTDYKKPQISECRKTNKRQHTLRRILVPALCLLLTFCTIFGVYAYSPAFKQYINMLFFKNNQRLTAEELSENQTPIYTTDDLNNIRDTSGSFVLMNDLYFTDADYEVGGKFEGGFEPITSGYYETFENTTRYIRFNIDFNGNGYVIHNLKINVENTSCVGLFIDVDTVKNLGINNCVINYTGLSGSSIYDQNICGTTGFNVGIISSKATRILGCYVDNAIINIDAKNRLSEAAIGGICGNAEIIDSCYSNTIININCNITSAYIGGIVGIVDACITSYFCGEINTNAQDNIKIDNIAAKSLNVPLVMHKSQFDMIVKKIDEELNDSSSEEDCFNVKKFKAYYMLKSPNGLNDIEYKDFKKLYPSFQDYFFCDISSWSEEWYVYDPCASLKEDIVVMDVLQMICSDDEIISMFDSFGVKYDKCYCLTIDKDEKYCEDDFEQFDFENIWIMKEGKPVLQIFEK